LSIHLHNDLLGASVMNNSID